MTHAGIEAAMLLKNEAVWNVTTKLIGFSVGTTSWNVTLEVARRVTLDLIYSGTIEEEPRGKETTISQSAHQ